MSGIFVGNNVGDLELKEPMGIALSHANSVLYVVDSRLNRVVALPLTSLYLDDVNECGDASSLEEQSFPDISTSNWIRYG
jgi:sugar lactone lactonase YvrE